MFLKKSLGQHFLKDKNILAKEALLLNPKGKIVLEIGPGDGRLTEQLLFAGAKKVIAIEKDTRLSSLLEEKFAGKPVEILNSDFLDLKPNSLGQIEKIIGNIPYYISSPIIFSLKEFEFEDALLMVQEEFARKMVALPNSSNYGRLSVTSNLFYDVKYVQKVPKHLFTPPPLVDSAIILLKKKLVSPEKGLEDLINSLFQHKNKTIRIALSDAGFTKDKLGRLDNYLKKRPRELNLAQIIEIYDKIRK